MPTSLRHLSNSTFYLLFSTAQNLGTAVTESTPTDPAPDITTTTELQISTEPPPPIGSFENPASSCSNISHDSPSGEYWIQNNNTISPFQVYCDKSPRNCSCNSTGGWTRVANLDMTDPSQQCPDGFSLVTSTSPRLRLCNRTETEIGCVSVVFPVNGIKYSNVCGRVIAYQYGAPFAFYLHSAHNPNAIDTAYVDGISLTYGQTPRQHIWTFAAGSDEFSKGSTWICPCSGGASAAVPSFVGGDYFCETANHVNSWTYGTPFYDHPLWAGRQCGTDRNDQCCSFNNPPWFCKELPLPTTDDIELRQCNGYSQSSETPFEIVEIYVK